MILDCYDFYLWSIGELALPNSLSPDFIYQLNKEFPLLIDYLSIVEKEFLIKKAQNPIFKELISDLHMLTNKTLILFGSAVIDFKTAQDIDIICLEKLDLTQLESKYRKSFHILQVNDLNDIKVALETEIKKKHIIISNVEQVVKWLL